jgi:hypothetical protein
MLRTLAVKFRPLGEEEEEEEAKRNTKKGKCSQNVRDTNQIFFFSRLQFQRSSQNATDPQTFPNSAHHRMQQTPNLPL